MKFLEFDELEKGSIVECSKELSTLTKGKHYVVYETLVDEDEAGLPLICVLNDEGNTRFYGAHCFHVTDIKNIQQRYSIRDEIQEVSKQPLTPEQPKGETMTSKEYLAFMKITLDKMYAICEKKNADYAGGGDDAFYNFTRVDVLGFATTEQGFLTRMLDKVCRIASFVKLGTLEVKEESVEDTLLDLANYCILFAGYLQSRKPKVYYMNPTCCICWDKGYIRKGTSEERVPCICKEEAKK